MSAFSTAFTQFFAALTVLFTAFTKIASTVDNLATVADESSGAYCDEARIQRQMKLAKLNHERDAGAKLLTTT